LPGCWGGGRPLAGRPPEFATQPWTKRRGFMYRIACNTTPVLQHARHKGLPIGFRLNVPPSNPYSWFDSEEGKHNDLQLHESVSTSAGSQILVANSMDYLHDTPPISPGSTDTGYIYRSVLIFQLQAWFGGNASQITKQQAAPSARELQSRQPRIHATLGHQLMVRALLHQLAVVQHQNAIGLLHGGQAVGNDQRGAALHG
jgi:hypothetical protein